MRWSQGDLARALEQRTADDSWTNYKVSKIENGILAVDADVLSLIAEVQGCSIDWYFQPVESYPEPPASSGGKGLLLNSERVASITPLRRRALQPVNDVDEALAA